MELEWRELAHERMSLTLFEASRENGRKIRPVDRYTHMDTQAILCNTTLYSHQAQQECMTIMELLPNRTEF